MSRGLTPSLKLLVLLWGFSNAQNLKGCSDGSLNITYSTGAQFQICPNTDYQVPSSMIKNAVTSVSNCSQLCMESSGCTKAVYDHINAICHIKGNPNTAPFVSSSAYDTISYLTTITDKSTIAICPNEETRTQNSDGSQIVICPMSDYQVPSINIVNSVANVASCANLCSSTPNCKKAVYDHINFLCHIKGDPQNVLWVVSLKQYDSIRIVYPQGTTTTRATTTSMTTMINPKTSTGQGTTMSTKTTISTKATSSTPTTGSVPNCPSGATYYRTDDGSLYQFCPQSDYQGTTARIIQNVLSDWNCMQICNQGPSCSKVVYDSKNLVCHIKASDVIFATSSQYNTVTFVNKTVKASAPYSGLGSWSPVIVMPVIPVAAYVVPQQPVSSRVLMFSSWGPDDFSGPTGMTQFADYNFQTGAVSARTITNTQHDMFCPGISALQDGRIVITGGENAAVTSFYDPASDGFVRGPDMNIPRGYQSSTTTSAGKIFTIGGSFSGGIGGKTGELFDPASNTWTVLNGADVNPILTTDGEGPWRTDNHAWLYGWKGQSVFQAGPSKQQHWFDTTGQGRVVAAAVRDPDNDAMCAVNVMYDAVAGKIFSTGGSQSYTNSAAFTKSFITTIGEPYQGSQVERVADMHYARGFANGVVLPDGKILVTGGQKTSAVFSDVDSVLTPELFDPVRKTFTVLAPAAIPRNYHSVALLLPNGTVFTAGGGMCPTAYGQSDAWCYTSAGYRLADHPSAEIFSPPYLFNADGSMAARPVIFALSSSTDGNGSNVIVGGTLTVFMNDASLGTTFALIRLGSSTHSINTDQRRIPLTSVVANQAQWTIQLPNDPGILLPGYYYLFAISKAGVPSVARTIQVKLGAAT